MNGSASLRYVRNNSTHIQTAAADAEEAGAIFSGLDDPPLPNDDVLPLLEDDLDLLSMRFHVLTRENGWILVDDPAISSTTDINDNMDISRLERRGRRLVSNAELHYDTIMVNLMG